MRIATTTANEQVIDNVGKQQSKLADLRSRLASSLRVDKPSDDPAAAAQAERVRTRQARLDAETRMIDAARTTLQSAEGAMGSGIAGIGRNCHSPLSHRAGSPWYAPRRGANGATGRMAAASRSARRNSGCLAIRAGSEKSNGA